MGYVGYVFPDSAIILTRSQTFDCKLIRSPVGMYGGRCISMLRPYQCMTRSIFSSVRPSVTASNPKGTFCELAPSTLPTIRAFHHQRTYHTATRLPRVSLLASSGLAALFVGFHVHCQSSKNDSAPSPVLPELTLYQYQMCPYCNKARAFLDYHDIGYNVVEVDLFFRRKLKSFKYRKVPFIMVNGMQVGDSNLLVSVLRTSMVTGLSVSEALDLYPEMNYTDSKGKEQTERANKYFIMYGEAGTTAGVSIDERREEREWREWVDTKLVHCMLPNICRTYSEALQTFRNITRTSDYGTIKRFFANYFGATGMYFLARSLKKRYNLKPDVRQSLYDVCDEWVTAIGKHRQFMGGKKPNLADLAVYGVLNVTEDLDTFQDLMENTGVGPWYQAVKEEVTQHRGINRS